MMKKIMAFSAFVLSAQVSFADDAYDRYDAYETDASMTNSFVFHEEAKTDRASLQRRASHEDLVKSFSSIDRQSDNDGYASDEDEDLREEVSSSQRQGAEKIQENLANNQPGFVAQAWIFAKNTVSTAYSFIRSFF